jgi:hypothetical protein
MNRVNDSLNLFEFAEFTRRSVFALPWIDPASEECKQFETCTRNFIALEFHEPVEDSVLAIIYTVYLFIGDFGFYRVGEELRYIGFAPGVREAFSLFEKESSTLH